MKRVYFLLFVLSNGILSYSQNFGIQGGGQSSGSSIGFDKFTGTANITVPLLSRNVGGVHFNASLNYNTRGIRLNDVAKESGLGWEFRYGFTMSRIIKGLPDEGYHQSSSSMGRWHQVIPNGGTQLDNATTQQDVATNEADGQSDLFSVSVNGVSVNFFFDSDNNIHTIPSTSGLIIQRIINGTSMAVFPKGQIINSLSFRIIDQSGNTYSFIPTASLSLSNSNNYSNYSAPIEWNIEYVETYLNERVDFTYLPTMVINYCSDISEEFASYNGINQRKLETIYSSVSKRYLEKVLFKDITFKINYHSIQRLDVVNEKTIDNVEIYENDNYSAWGFAQQNPSTIGVNSKKIKFNYKYFSVEGLKPFNSLYTPTIAPPNSSSIPGSIPASLRDYRLCLDNVEEIMNNSTANKLVEFDYWDVNTTGTPDQNKINLSSPNGDYIEYPYRLGPSQDYWGFYNGNTPIGAYYNIGTSAQGNIETGGDPIYMPEFNGHGVNREPNEKNKIFALKKVKNRSGKSTEFIYGLNTINVNGVPKNLDGLRLEKVIMSDHLGMSNTTIEHEYVYQNGEWNLPINTNPLPDIKSLFIRQTDIDIAAVPQQGPQQGSPAVFIPNVDVYTNHFLGQVVYPQHGYGIVTEKKRSYNKNKNVNSGNLSVTTESLGESKSYYITLNNIPSNVNVSGSSSSGNNYTTPNSSLVLNAPSISNPSFNNLNLVSGVNLHLPFNAQTYTYKQYYNEGLLGLPYKIETFNHLGHKVSESETYYDISVKVLDLPSCIQLNSIHKVNNLFPFIPLGVNSTGGYNILSDYYFPFVIRTRINHTQEKIFINNTNSVLSSTHYTYNASDKLIGVKYNKPNGDESESLIKYSSDFLNAGVPIFDNLATNNIILPFYNELWTKEQGQPAKLTTASMTSFTTHNGKILPQGVYSLTGDNVYLTSPLNVPLIQSVQSFLPVNDFTHSPRVSSFDANFSPIEINDKGKVHCQIYDIYSGSSIAEISNASPSEVAYTSFESNIVSTLNDNDKGNWSYSPAGIKTTGEEAITGRRCFNLSSSTWYPAEKITSNSSVVLQPGKKYIISFWLKNSSSVTVSNWQQNGQSLVSQSIQPTLHYTNTSSLSRLNNWKYYEATFIANYSKITIEGSGLIDEVRLYPAESTMETNCYNFLYGLQSSCDENNQIVHYSYDPNTKVKVQRDRRGNIISKSQTSIQKTDN